MNQQQSHGAPRPTDVYRKGIGLFQRARLAPNTFIRHCKTYELLKPESEVTNKERLAFAKAHANEMWQADTMFGPYVKNGEGRTQTKLIAFIDDASRVCCHAEFYLAENTDTLVLALRSALYKRGIPESLYVDNGSIYMLPPSLPSQQPHLPDNALHPNHARPRTLISAE